MIMAQGSGRSGGAQAQDDFDHSQRRSPPTRENMSQMEAMKIFMVIQPPSFAGELDIGLEENWLRRIKRIFDGLYIPGEGRVGFAAYMLVNKADFGGETMKQAHNIEAMTWDQFERIFRDKYFGEVAKHT